MKIKFKSLNYKDQKKTQKGTKMDQIRKPLLGDSTLPKSLNLLKTETKYRKVPLCRGKSKHILK